MNTKTYQLFLLALNSQKLPLGETPWLTEHHVTSEVALFFDYHHVTYRTLCHASGYIVIHRECYGSERAFLPFLDSQAFFTLHSFLLVFSRASCWPSKHSPGLTICLNPNNPQKIYMSRFYLRLRLDSYETLAFPENWLYRKLALRKIDFTECLLSTWSELFSPIGRRVRSLMFYPFSYRVIQSSMN